MSKTALGGNEAGLWSFLGDGLPVLVGCSVDEAAAAQRGGRLLEGVWQAEE